MHRYIKWLWQYYRRHKYVLGVLLILTPIQTLFQVAVPRLFGYVIDFLNTGVVGADRFAIWLTEWGARFDLSPTTSYGLGFILIGLIASILYATLQSHRAWMNSRLEFDFRQVAFDGVTEKGPDFFNRFRTGDLVTRMTDDVAEKLSWFACSGIFRLYEALLVVAFTVIMMLSIDPWLTLWTAGPLPILVIVFFISASALDKRYDHLQKKISSFNDAMEACFSGIRVVKAYVREEMQKEKFGSAARDRRQAEIDSIKMTTVIDSLYYYIWQFALVIVLIVGGYMVINSGLTVGKMATFIYYVVYLVFPMFDIGQFLVKSRQSAVSITRLVELEEMPAMVADSGDQDCDPGKDGHLEFINVDFGFDGTANTKSTASPSRKILDGLTLKITAGQTVALVGRVGAGKSWLINMIPRLVDPAGGTITLGGRELRHFRLEDLRRQIGYVPQEPVLFSDTLLNNILLGRENIPEERISWAVDVAQLKDDIENLPLGMNTPVGTRGMMLSGGQKQRLALARALVGKPGILILDDCTSALDSSTEAKLWDRLHEVMPDITAILITHRPGTLETVDNIYVMDGGRIVQSGTHNELVEQSGEYATIYKRYRLAEEVTKG